jgi:hypothetical protein
VVVEELAAVVLVVVEVLVAVEFLNMILNQGFLLRGLPDKLAHSREWVGKLRRPRFQGLVKAGVNLVSNIKPVDTRVWIFTVNTGVQFVVRPGVLLSEQDMRALMETLSMLGTKTEQRHCMHIYLESQSSQVNESRLDKPWGEWGQLDEPRVHIFISR